MQQGQALWAKNFIKIPECYKYMKTTTYIGAFCIIAAVVLLLNSCSGESSKAIRVGDAIASFSGTDLAGKPFTLASHNGKPVIMRFFLLNCPYCKADTPIFNTFYNKYRQKGLEIVYINNNGTNAEEVKVFARELNIDFPVIFDQEGKIAKQYNVKVQPLTLVLSPEHKLLAALLGGVSEAELNELLGQYMQ
jgi:peroxiredoxin